MPDLDGTEREHLLAQLRQLSGLTPIAPLAPTAPTGPAPAPPRLMPLELRRIMPHLARLAAFKAEHSRLPSAAPSAPTGERSLGAWLWRQRRAREAGSLHPHAAELLEDALGPHWHLPPRKAQTLEHQDPEAR
jgi:hypothetical protein